MKNSAQKKSIWLYVLYAFTGLSFLALMFITNRSVTFMADDIWYSRKLDSMEGLTSFGDILEFEIWHYFHWGGRSITHSILQLTLMSGLFWADVLNTLMFVLFCYVVTSFVPKRTNTYRIPLMLLTGFLTVAINPTIFNTLFWQAGTVNYLYSTTWILTFLLFYMRALSGDEKQPLGITVWMLPLGLITGWSNENMGPAAFVTAVLSIVYLWRKKRKIPAFMYVGALGSFVGSLLVILAPGNFVRGSGIEGGAVEKILVRVQNFARATFVDLLPTFLTVIFVLAIYLIVLKKELRLHQLLLILMIVLAHSAMLLSPTYPTRATFGVFALCVTLIISMLREFSENREGLMAKRAEIILFLAMYVFAMVSMAELWRYPTVS